MTWLRLDDKFPRHPKLLKLTVRERWLWVELLSFCAQFETKGVVDPTTIKAINGVTSRYLDKCHKVGLIDIDDDGTKRVHDWETYNPKDPTKSERQARWRRRKRDGLVDAPVDGLVDTPSRPYTPIEGGRTVDPRTPAAAPATPNGAAPLTTDQLEHLAAFVRLVWDEYPNPVDLHAELTDRGASDEQAGRIIGNEHRSRTPA